MRLARGAPLPGAVARPGYDPAGQTCGIVHIGFGAFARAHLAAYTDAALRAGDRDWMITGVSMRSEAAAAAINPQDGLFTLTERGDGGERVRLIDSVRQVLVAPRQRAAVVAALAAAATRIISFTITEKGYCRGPGGGLDARAAEADSIYPLLGEALSARRAAGAPGVTLLSCDNLAGNGAVLARLLDQWLEPRDAALAAWVREACRFPATMVDRIVPAIGAADREAVAAALGLEDAAAVVTEPFRQWVIEDRFAGPRPCWEADGAQFTDDVAPFEAAKLRMLNGAHSALAYLGLARGHAHVHAAIADPALAALIARLMEEAASSLTPAPGQDLRAYARALLARFANPALPHRLRQIAMDGSQKIPQRWLATLAFHQARGERCPAILAALSAWIGFVGAEGPALADPMAQTLHRLWTSGGRAGLVQALFGPDGVFAPQWQAAPAELALLEAPAS